MGGNDFHTTLYRIDPIKNMARFYTLSIQPNLFGGYSLIRRWGRIGSRGQIKVKLFDNDQDAVKAHKFVTHSKLKRGYL